MENVNGLNEQDNMWEWCVVPSLNINPLVTIITSSWLHL